MSIRRSKLLFSFFILLLIGLGSTIAFSIFFTFSPARSQEISSQVIVQEESKRYHIFYVPHSYQGGTVGTGFHQNYNLDMWLWSGPAVLEMVFAHYGVSVTQAEIAKASNTDKYYAGTSYEGFLDAIRYSNYSSRDYGFQGEIISLANCSKEERWEFMRSYVDREIPIVQICKFPSFNSLHYRVLTGYDDRLDVFYFNDPWYGPPNPMRGPNSACNTNNLDSRWVNTDYRIAIIRPIEITLEIEDTPISEGSEFELTCRIMPSPLTAPSDLTVNLSLADGYSLTSGLEITGFTAVEGEFVLSWNISSPLTPSANDVIEVKVTSPHANETYGRVAQMYPCRVKAPTISPLVTEPALPNDEVPYKFNITTEISYEEDCNVTLMVGTGNSVNGSDPLAYSVNKTLVGANKYYIHATLGPYAFSKSLICWLQIETPYEYSYSSMAIYLVIDLDTDLDGVGDYAEIEKYGTNPFNNDTDLDGLPDGWEIMYETDPLLNDGKDDPDGDELTNLEEFKTGTDPQDADSDDDGLTDREELLKETNPLNNDTDLDGLPDGWEISFGTDPCLNDAGDDPDGDGLINLEEFRTGTNPHDADTDHDGMGDGAEVYSGFNPLDPYSNITLFFLSIAGLSALIGLGIIGFTAIFIIRKKNV
ncbi:MAG: C39 family peptidase [Promethearchaeota archaeon]